MSRVFVSTEMKKAWKDRKRESEERKKLILIFSFSFAVASEQHLLKSHDFNNGHLLLDKDHNLQKHCVKSEHSKFASKEDSEQ